MGQFEPYVRWLPTRSLNTTALHRVYIRRRPFSGKATLRAESAPRYIDHLKIAGGKGISRQISRPSASARAKSWSPAEFQAGMIPTGRLEIPDPAAYGAGIMSSDVKGEAGNPSAL